MEIILDILDIVLERNYFNFAGEFYMQIKGVAMGLTAAPSIANLDMADIENRIICNLEKIPSFHK